MRIPLVFLIAIPYAVVSVCVDEEPGALANERVVQEDESSSGVNDDVRDPMAMTKGPSGTLIQPQGGRVYQNHVGNVGNVEVIYKGVSDGSNEFGARTCTIDIHLVPKSSHAVVGQEQFFNISSPSVMSLAYGMRPHDSGSSQPIWANFVPPPGACGDYHLVVYERQLFENTVIHFQSAAPVITFQCAHPAPKIYPPGSVIKSFDGF